MVWVKFDKKPNTQSFQIEQQSVVKVLLHEYAFAECYYLITHTIYYLY